jgi:hypothetical protein
MHFRKNLILKNTSIYELFRMKCSYLTLAKKTEILQQKPVLAHDYIQEKNH